MSEVAEFIRGQSDCNQGKPHKPNQSEAYSRGYAAQYELEQVSNERTRNRGNS
jgi:hypothetical protein